MKEIKDRMNSVAETQKITNAMYLISSTKMEKARRELEATRPYFVALRGEIKRIFRTAGHDVQSRYFFPLDEREDIEGTYGLLVITADKGLAGSYNQNVIREAERLLKDHEDTKLYVVGEYGRHYFMKHGIPIEQSFLYTAQNPSLKRAREINRVLQGEFDEGNLKKILIVYTDLKNQMTGEAISYRLLPLHRKFFIDTQDKPVTTEFEFLPSVEEVLDSVTRSYMAGFIYSALVDSFCCEQNARMQAMKSANDNAADIISELSVEYNSVRQGAITQEITEVSAGAKAQAQKHNKEAYGR